MVRCIRPLPALAVLLLAAAVLLGAADALHAQSFRVLVSTERRQLRSMQLEVTGYATSRTGSEEQLRREALDDARRRAVAVARENLEGKIASRGLDLHLAFLGEPGVMPLQESAGASPAASSAEAVARTAVFIHEADRLGITPTADEVNSPFALTVRAEVVYVLQPRAGEEADRPKKPHPLPMAPAGESPARLEGEAGRKIREDAEKDMARQLLEALTTGDGPGTPERETLPVD
jgi:hypothetical protein